ncbi:MAG: 5-dehydro-4-deoxy-D-glucuronate isomerase [Verrucomicrobia bacterium]|nr:5-dehydro-4-deoxy-D-glucuronate isomerase [Verrucomicrobiota bacterium]
MIAIRNTHSPVAVARMTTAELRAAFLVDTLFKPGTLDLTYWEVDRTIVGSATPTDAPIPLLADAKLLAAEFFLQRRELGVLNVGGPGTVTADGATFRLEKTDALYVGRGTRDVAFASDDPANPARFFLISYPAHADIPTTPAPATTARQVQLGTVEKANARTITQQIHEGGVRSSQLVMGHTTMGPGGVWNTFPPHTHLRRSEVYLYFDLGPDDAVMHFMGTGDETRHLVVRAGQAVLSPAWSIHSGCGTCAYRFIWAMGGENQRFDDMDAIPVRNLL